MPAPTARQPVPPAMPSLTTQASDANESLIAGTSELDITNEQLRCQLTRADLQRLSELVSQVSGAVQAAHADSPQPAHMDPRSSPASPGQAHASRGVRVMEGVQEDAFRWYAPGLRIGNRPLVPLLCTTCRCCRQSLDWAVTAACLALSLTVCLSLSPIKHEHQNLKPWTCRQESDGMPERRAQASVFVDGGWYDAQLPTGNDDAQNLPDSPSGRPLLAQPKQQQSLCEFRSCCLSTQKCTGL